ncbi:MAG: helix-turn-helix transcriptional regulator [Clostridia bacterium]|nr:helix-turn-helix transcriptional regulator [Clostridia bacterium]
MQKINYEKLGQKIKMRRKDKKLTQEILAEMCNISTGFLGHIENGTRSPSLETLFGIANSLDCGVDYFLFDSYSKNDAFLCAIGESVRQKSENDYKKLCNTVKILAEHIDEI